MVEIARQAPDKRVIDDYKSARAKGRRKRLVPLENGVNVGAMECIDVNTNQGRSDFVLFVAVVSDQVAVGCKEPAHATDVSIGNQSQRPM